MSIDPEQQEIEEKLQEIRQLTDRLIDIEQHFAEQYIEMRRCAYILQAQLTPLYSRLDRWELRTEATNYQLEKYRDMRDQILSPTEDPFAIERESFTQTISQKKPQQTAKIYEPPSRPSTALRNLYHALLIRFYPEIETDDEKRLQRTAIMSKIAQAFVEQDMQTLQECEQKLDIPLSQEPSTDLVRIVRRIARLRSLCKAGEERNKAQEESPIGQLLQYFRKKTEQEEEPFEEITELLEELIDQKKFFWLNQQLRSAQLLTEVDP